MPLPWHSIHSNQRTNHPTPRPQMPLVWHASLVVLELPVLYLLYVHLNAGRGLLTAYPGRRIAAYGAVKVATALCLQVRPGPGGMGVAVEARRGGAPARLPCAAPLCPPSCSPRAGGAVFQLHDASDVALGTSACAWVHVLPRPGLRRSPLSLPALRASCRPSCGACCRGWEAQGIMRYVRGPYATPTSFWLYGRAHARKRGGRAINGNVATQPIPIPPCSATPRNPFPPRVQVVRRGRFLRALSAPAAAASALPPCPKASGAPGSPHQQAAEAAGASSHNKLAKAKAE